MAKLNSRRFELVAKLKGPEGGVIAVRSDGKILQRKPWGGYFVRAKVKEGITPEQFVERMVEKGWEVMRR